MGYLTLDIDKIQFLTYIFPKSENELFRRFPRLRRLNTQTITCWRPLLTTYLPITAVNFNVTIAFRRAVGIARVSAAKLNYNVIEVTALLLVCYYNGQC